MRRQLERFTHTDGSRLAAETELHLESNTRHVRFSEEMSGLYRAASWERRGQIARSWAVLITLLNLGFIPLSYVLMPHIVVHVAVSSLVVFPITHGGLYVVWRRPRRSWIEGASVLLSTTISVFGFCMLGTMADETNSERLATGALFTVFIAMLIFGIERRWTIATAIGAMAIYAFFMLKLPTVPPPVAVSMIIHYAMATVAIVLLRHWLEIENRTQFLTLLRDIYRGRQLTATNKALESLATRDPLTGLANRRSANAMIAAIWNDPKISKTRVAFIMADIDHFKALNDSAGHAAGDECITRVAHAIAAAARKGDITCRHGGEEFLVVLPEMTLRDAESVAERIRGDVEALALENPGLGPGATITLSLGIAFASNFEAPATVIKRADDALYAAKKTGRNRVCFEFAEVAHLPATMSPDIADPTFPAKFDLAKVL